MSVLLTRAIADLQQASLYGSQTQTADGDYAATKQDIAQEAIRLQDSGRTQEAALFATFLQGGKDGNGLFPDILNGSGQPGQDGVISTADLAALAAEDTSLKDSSGNSIGNANTISSTDFQVFGGSNYQAGGNTIDFNQLYQVAYPGNTTTSTDATTTTNTGQSTNMNMLLLAMLLSLFGGSVGGSSSYSNLGSVNPYTSYGSYGGYNPFSSYSVSPYSSFSSYDGYNPLDSGYSG